MAKKAIHSNQVFLPEEIKAATIFIDDGRISRIEDGYFTHPDYEIETVQEMVLMSGIIDPHVHINEPGRTHWEGFDAATKAALAGGVTTLVEMPLNASPVTTSAFAFDQKLIAAKGKLHVNCGFWGGIVPGNEKDVEPMIAAGVLGFKAFLTHSGIDDFPNVTRADLEKVMPVLAAYNLPLLVHCELSSANSTLNNPALSKNYNNYLASRPKEWEDNAIDMMLELCEKYNCHTHIVHLSSANSIAKIVNAKAKGLPVTVETAQHYLHFNAEEIEDGNTLLKCAPPIRERKNNEMLWQALIQGSIDFVATDHSPAPPELKEIDSGNFMTAWGGISSLQFSLPALYTAALKHNTDIKNISEWLCSKPANLPKLQQTKGKIKLGYDADFVVWNPAEKLMITKETIYHLHPLTPYLQQPLYGKVMQTWIGGKKVFENNNFLHLQQGKIIKAGNIL